jgi:hypothetical protein
MKDQKLTQFTEHILRLTPKYIDAFGTGLPGMAGTSSGTSGAFNAASDITLKLQRAVASFAKLYSNSEVALEKLGVQAKEIEGLLLAEETISALTAKETNLLVDELYDLMEQKR